MDRRGFMRIAAAAAPIAALAEVPLAEAAAAPAASLTTKIVRLNLRHAWTTTMSTSTYRDTLHVTYCRDGITGRGEGAPIVRYHENVAEARQAAESVRDLLLDADPMHFAKTMSRVFQRVKGNWAGKAAVDIALMDWVGKKLGVPLYSYFGLDPADAPVTTFSIGIDTPEITRQKTREAADFPVLKIKVGLATDEPTIEAVRSVTKKPLRVDANEGWKNKEEVVRKINWLEKQGVEFMEQPMPAEMIEETAWVRRRVHIPIIADESCCRASDIPKLRDAFDGVNIKLDKSGGTLGGLPHDPGRQGAGHEDHAGLHGLQFGDRDGRRPSFPAGRLRRPRRQSADRQRPVSRREGRERQAAAAQGTGAGADVIIPAFFASQFPGSLER